MSKENHYQWGFDFPSRSPSIPYEMASNWYGEDNQIEGVSRFTRTLREPIAVHTPEEAANYLLTRIYTPFESFTQEELWVLLMNTKNRVTHEVMVYRGMIDAVYLRQAEVFREAIRFNARAILLSHCHPSGDPTPSIEDVRFNEECGEAAKILGVNLIDHIVVGDNSWFSLRNLGARSGNFPK